MISMAAIRGRKGSGEKKIKQPGADEAPDHTVDSQGPVNRNAVSPPAAPEDIGQVEDHGREHQKKDGRPHIRNQGQKRGGDHGETDADGARGPGPRRR